MTLNVLIVVNQPLRDALDARINGIVVEIVK